MGQVINKQADFVVRFAKNIESKTLAERTEILATASPKVRTLVNQALQLFAAKRARSKHDAGFPKD